MSTISLQNTLNELSGIATEHISETQWNSIYVALLKPEVDIDISYSSGPYKGTSLIWWLAYHGKWNYIIEALQVRINYSEIFDTKPPYYLLRATSRGTFSNGVSLLSLALLAKERNFVEYMVFECECAYDSSFICDDKECSNQLLASQNGYIEVLLEILGLLHNNRIQKGLLGIDFTNIVRIAFESNQIILLQQIFDQLVTIDPAIDDMIYVVDYVYALIDYINQNEPETHALKCVIKIVTDFEKLCGERPDDKVADFYRRAIYWLAHKSEINATTINLFFEHYLSSRAFCITDLQYFYALDNSGVLHSLPSKYLLVQKIIQSGQWRQFYKYLVEERDTIISLSSDIKSPEIKSAIENSQWDLLQLLDQRFVDLPQDQPDVFKWLSSLFLTIYNGGVSGERAEDLHKTIILYIHHLIEIDIDADVLKRNIAPGLSKFLKKETLWQYLGEYLFVFTDEKLIPILETLVNTYEIIEFARFLTDYRPRVCTFELGRCELSGRISFDAARMMFSKIEHTRINVFEKRRGGSNNDFLLKHQQFVENKLAHPDIALKASFTKALELLVDPIEDDLNGLRDKYLHALFLSIREKTGKRISRHYLNLLVVYYPVLVPCVLAEIDRSRENPLFYLVNKDYFRGRCINFLLDYRAVNSYARFIFFLFNFHARLNSYRVFVNIVTSVLDDAMRNAMQDEVDHKSFLSIIRGFFQFCVENIWPNIANITSLCRAEFEQRYKGCIIIEKTMTRSIINPWRKSPEENFDDVCRKSFQSFFYVFCTCFWNDVEDMLRGQPLFSSYEKMPEEVQARIASYFLDMTPEIKRSGTFKNVSIGQLRMLQKHVKQNLLEIVSSLPFVALELYNKLVLIIYSMILRNLLNNESILSAERKMYRKEGFFCLWSSGLYRKVSPQIGDLICTRLSSGKVFQMNDREQLYKMAQTYDFHPGSDMEQAFTLVLRPRI